MASKAVTATPLQTDGMSLNCLDSNTVRLQHSSDRNLVLYSLCLLRKQGWTSLSAPGSFKDVNLVG